VKVLVLQHDHDTPLGSLEEPLRDEGCTPVSKFVTGGEELSLDPFAGLVVLGGAAHPDGTGADEAALALERNLIRDALARELPVLGICLGGQLVAQAAGGSAGPAPVAELGWYDVEVSAAGRADELLGGMPERFPAFQWHYYRVQPPAGAQVLARNENAVQAFRVGSAWGLQFHIEATAELIAEWALTCPEELDALGVDADTLLVRTGREMPAYRALAAGIGHAFGATVARSAEVRRE
jgi:GMP synthase-like glutamine amidotransferase